MTINDILNSEKDVINLTDIAEILGSDPATLRETMKQHPEYLKPLEPVTVGNRSKISRMRFLGWYFGSTVPVQHMEGENNVSHTNA